MPIETRRATATDRSGIWSAFGGAATLHGAVSDEDDDTGIQATDDANGSDAAVLDGLGWAGLPAGALIRAIRHRMRVSTNSTGGLSIAQELRHDGDLVDQMGWEVPDGGNSDEVVEVESSWQAERPDGESWDGDDLDDLAWAYLANGVFPSFSDEARVHEAELDIDYDERPVATITAPTGTVTDTARPTVEWGYSDPEGDAQEAFEVKVFHGDDEPGGGWPDDPDDIAADPVYDSGTVNSSSGSHDIADDLDNDSDFAVYVRVRQEWDGLGEHWSDWDHGTFTLDLDEPAAPDVTLTAQPDDARVRIEISDGTGGDAPAEWFRVQYRDDPGDDWADLRDAAELEPDGSGDAQALDRWSWFNVEREYRVRAYIQLTDGPSASPSTTGSATVETDARWVTDVRDPDRLHAKVEATRGQSLTMRGRDAVHRPAGMSVAVVESETPTDEHEITLAALDSDEHDLLRAALKSTRTLLYRDRRDRVFFRWVGDRTRTQQGPDAASMDVFSGRMVEVEEPPL